MASARLIGIVGRKDSGKTTLLVALAAGLVRRGMKVATLKHGHHPASDREGKDTWRHFNEGGASPVLIESPGARVLFERTEEEGDPITLARRFLSDADVILVEGFKHFPIPMIEVHRRAIHPDPLIRTDPDLPGGWLAVITDDAQLNASCPVFRFSDTAWLTTLTSIALDGALTLDEPS